MANEHNSLFITVHYISKAVAFRHRYFLRPNAVFEKTEKVFGPGHCSVTAVTEEGREVDLLVYHANLESGSGWNGRHVFLQPFTWDGDTPILGVPTL